MARIGKSFSFEAAHRLQHHGGKCRSLHGHSYRVEIAITGDIQESHPLVVGVDEDTASAHNPAEGMILDFGELNEWWRTIEIALDHVTILEVDDPLAERLRGLPSVVLTLFDFPPTAENLAAWILQELQIWLLRRWPNGFPTPAVRVYETAKSWAEG